MAPTSRVALIFGAGSNIGAGLVQGFLGAGYRVATVSRSQPAAAVVKDTYPIQADISDPKAVPGVFAQLASAGLPFPSVVIWNAAARSAPAEAGNPLEVDEESLGRDLDLMIKSPYVAAREAVRAWRAAPGGEGRPSGRKGTFIMTGNLLPRQVLPAPALVTLGVGKSGANSWIGLSDLTFKKEGIRFFFADERTAAGGPVGAKPDGPGHAEIFLRLVEDEELPHYVTFVDGKYKEFFP